MNGLMQSLRNLGPMRLAAMGGMGLAILAFFIYLMSRIAQPGMELLYGNLELTDASQIVKALEAQKIPFELRRDGSEVWVPKDRKLELRVKMAEQNLPSGGAVNEGYELFDKQDALGTTGFMQNVNLVRALEGELARTIRSISKVKAARVHLVMPKREVFSRETQEPSASVILRMDGNGRLGKQEVEAVRHLIAAAVPKLKPHRISIVDDKGTLLARGYENEQEMIAQSSEEMRLNYENRLARTVETLLERSVGPGRVRAEVTAEMDFDRVATTEEIYDPESRVVRSQTTVEEGEQSRETDPASVSVAQNLPDAGLNNDADGVSSSSQNRVQETVNYEISKVTRNHVKELGSVKRLSVAVLVDGVYNPGEGEGAENVYQPRSEAEMDQLATLVRSAIGYDGGRGDMVEVINMQFAGGEVLEAPVEDLILGMPRDLVEQIGSNLGLSIVAILFLLLVLKPLVSRAVESMAPGAQATGRLLPDVADQPALAGPGMAGLSVGPDELEVDELIDIDKVEGRVKASSIRKIGEIVEKHPEEALSIIRNWMYQEG